MPARPELSGPFPIPTALGIFAVWFSRDGVARLDFPRSHARPALSLPINQLDGIASPWLAQTRTCVERIAAGQSPGPPPPLDLSRGTRFQQRVWRELLVIPAGRTRSYGEIAARLGKPGAARAVGGACGANPVPLLVPCHRVLAAGGRLGGFSGGLDWKIRLLRVEGGEARRG